jgi:hypothetical protein
LNIRLFCYGYTPDVNCFYGKIWAGYGCGNWFEELKAQFSRILKTRPYAKPPVGVGFKSARDSLDGSHFALRS